MSPLLWCRGCTHTLSSISFCWFWAAAVESVCAVNIVPIRICCVCCSSVQTQWVQRGEKSSSTDIDTDRELVHEDVSVWVSAVVCVQASAVELREKMPRECRGKGGRSTPINFLCFCSFSSSFSQGLPNIALEKREDAWEDCALSLECSVSAADLCTLSVQVVLLVLFRDDSVSADTDVVMYRWRM